MRRFSQRNSLVTLSDINITPLLDLAFVLLIIFIITTPLLEQGLNLKLPTGDVVDNKKIDPKDVRTVEVSTAGQYFMNGRWFTLQQITKQLYDEHRRNPRLLIYVRADENGPYKNVAAILNVLEANGIDQVSLRTSPRSK
jgi:biopolymer transport protein ExbD